MSDSDRTRPPGDPAAEADPASPLRLVSPPRRNARLRLAPPLGPAVPDDDAAPLRPVTPLRLVPPSLPPLDDPPRGAA